MSQGADEQLGGLVKAPSPSDITAIRIGLRRTVDRVSTSGAWSSVLAREHPPVALQDIACDRREPTAPRVLMTNRGQCRA